MASDGSQEAFELYYSETYSESSSTSLQDSHRSLTEVSDSGDNSAALLLMQEYMITVSVRVGECLSSERGQGNCANFVDYFFYQKKRRLKFCFVCYIVSHGELNHFKINVYFFS